MSTTIEEYGTMNLDELNKKYLDLTPQERIAELYHDFNPGKILYTSSFGTSAGVLLHMINSVRPEQLVHFLDTTYHFVETLEYKNALTEQLNLKVEDILPEGWKNEFTKTDKTWTKDADLCCSINKVEPLDKVKGGFDIWISGLMSSQNSFRKDLKIFDQTDDIIKFYPIIDFDPKSVKEYYAANNIPPHPLEVKGYSSIGCAQCTVKGKGREGRWSNKGKTECGLHMK